MLKPLTVRVRPEELAERRQAYDLNGVISDLQRLEAILSGDLESLAAAAPPASWQDAPVRIGLDFAWLDERRELATVSGQAELAVPAVCQRCLEAFVLEIDTAFRLVLPRRDAEPVTVAGFESFERESDTLRLQDLVEESLIMALPLAPVHPDPAACGPLVARISGGGAESNRPFADLKARLSGRE